MRKRKSGSLGGFAFAGLATGHDLEALRDEFHVVFGGECFAIPFHEGGVDLDNFVAILTDELRLECVLVQRGHVVLVIAAHIDLAD